MKEKAMQRREDIVDNSPMAHTASNGQVTRDMGTKDYTTSAQNKAAELGEKVHQKADEGMTKAADGVDTAAGKLRERAEHTDGMAAKAETKVADTMEQAAGYLREKDTTAVRGDVETFVREHPIQALAGAIVGGYVLGRIFH